MINQKYNRAIWLVILYLMFYGVIPMIFQRVFSSDEEMMRSAIAVVLVINVAFAFFTGFVDTLVNKFSFWICLLASLSFIPILLMLYINLPLFVSAVVYGIGYSAAAIAGGLLAIPTKKFFAKRRKNKALKKKNKPVNPYKNPF